MNEPAGIGCGLATLLIYVWAAAFVWHMLPEGKEWWLIPALLTTAFLGLVSLVLGLALGYWMTEEK